MKTTVEISDDLMRRVRAVARRDRATLKALIEEGLRLALRARLHRVATRPFKVEPFKGDGFTAEFAEPSWTRIRDEIYSGRG